MSNRDEEVSSTLPLPIARDPRRGRALVSHSSCIQPRHRVSARIFLRREHDCTVAAPNPHSVAGDQERHGGMCSPIQGAGIEPNAVNRFMLPNWHEVLFVS